MLFRSRDVKDLDNISVTHSLTQSINQSVSQSISRSNCPF